MTQDNWAVTATGMKNGKPAKIVFENGFFIEMTDHTWLHELIRLQLSDVEITENSCPGPYDPLRIRWVFTKFFDINEPIHCTYRGIKPPKLSRWLDME